MNFNRPLAMLGIASALLGGAVMQAGAQGVDPTLNEIFFTDANKATFGGSSYINNKGIGVGYDPISSFFANARTPGEAQSVFNPFQIVTDAASGNTAARTIIAGESIQFGLHGVAVGQTSPTSVWVSVLQFNPNAPAGTVPVLNTTSPIVAPQRIDFFPLSSASTDSISFSGTFTLANPLVLGQTYVLAISPTATAGGANPANYFVVDRTTTTNFAPSNSSPDNVEYTTTTNNADQGGAFTQQLSNNGIGFRIYAAPVPEMSSVAGLCGLTCALGLGFKLRRSRKRA